MNNMLKQDVKAVKLLMEVDAVLKAVTEKTVIPVPKAEAASNMLKQDVKAAKLLTEEDAALRAAVVKAAIPANKAEVANNTLKQDVKVANPPTEVIVNKTLYKIGQFSY